jgi:hypothetical protein
VSEVGFRVLGFRSAVLRTSTAKRLFVILLVVGCCLDKREGGGAVVLLDIFRMEGAQIRFFLPEVVALAPQVSVCFSVLAWHSIPSPFQCPAFNFSDHELDWGCGELV